MVIKEIRIKTLTLGEDGEKPTKVSGTYELVSDKDTVLATQPFNTYGGINVAFSNDTAKAVLDLRSAIAGDLNKQLGF